MKNVIKHYSLILAFLIFPIAIIAQNTLSAQDKKIMSDFEKHANDYVKLREKLESNIPKLKKDATAEQIEAHKTALQKSVQTARANVPQGVIFTPEAANLIRKIIKTEFQGKERIEMREKIFEAENKGIPVKVNAFYPDSKEQIEMPPKFLLSLPMLPKHLRYRFIGSNFVLVDREGGLIIDFMTNALP